MAELGLDATQLSVQKVTRELKEPPGRDLVLRRISHGLKERFGVGKYITRAEIRGGVGEPLTVTLGGVTLNSLLPPGVEFYGYRHIKYGNEETDWAKASYHHYSVTKKQIRLAVECEDDASFKLPIQKTPISGLIILHEMGHDEDDYNHPERRVAIVKNHLQADVFEGVEDTIIRSWYDEARVLARQFGGGIVITQSFQKDVDYAIERHVRKIASDRRIKGRNITDLISFREFDQLTEELAKKVSQETLGRWDALSSAEGFIAAVKSTRTDYQLALRAFLKKDTLRSEAKAWILAEKTEQLLKKDNPKLSLWNDDESSLRLLKAYFILHHPEVTLGDFPEGEGKQLLRGITEPEKYW